MKKDDTNRDLDYAFMVIAQEKYDNAKKKSVTNTRQKTSGRLYPGRTRNIINFRKAAQIALVTIGLAIAARNYAQTEKLVDYDAQFGKVVLDELSASDQLQFERYQNSTQGNFFEQRDKDKVVLEQIADKMDELADSGEYQWGKLNANLKEDAIKTVAQENALKEIEAMENTPSQFQELEDYIRGGNGRGK